MKTKHIEVWNANAEDLTHSIKKAGLPDFGGGSSTEVVDMSVLANNLKNVLSDFQEIVDETPKSTSGYQIDEIEISLGVNAKGGFALIGKLEAGMSAGVKVKIKKTK
jgi:hypothetical protein